MPTYEQLSELWDSEMWLNGERAKLDAKNESETPIDLFKVQLPGGYEVRIISNAMLGKGMAILSPDIYDAIKGHFESKVNNEPTSKGGVNTTEAE